MLRNNLVSQIFTTVPKTIFVKESVDAEPKEILLNEIENKFGITWTEEVNINGDTPFALDSAEDSRTESKLKDLAKYRKYLGLVNMGQPVGWCLYAREDIPRGVYITTYAGDYSNEPGSEKSGNYTMTFEQGNVGNKSRGAINGEKMRNFGGFLTHLPKNKDKYVFKNDKDKNELTLQNVRREVFKYHGGVVIAIKTCRPIKKGTLIGYDYWPSFETVEPYLFAGLKIVDANNYSTIQQITTEDNSGVTSSLPRELTDTQFNKPFPATRTHPLAAAYARPPSQAKKDSPSYNQANATKVRALQLL